MQINRFLWCFLRARGDVSTSVSSINTFVEFSPRTWRCFSKRRADCYLNAVFSTHVEMFLIDDVLEDVKDIFSSRM